MIYLENKDVAEFAGIEYYVNDKIKAKRVDWFPIGDTIFLS